MPYIDAAYTIEALETESGISSGTITLIVLIPILLLICLCSLIVVLLYVLKKMLTKGRRRFDIQKEKYQFIRALHKY